MSNPTLPRFRPGKIAGFVLAMVSFGSATWAAESSPRGWWVDEPVRFFQTNLSETASTLDAKRLVGQVADFPANVLLFNMGGIVAHYPTRVPFHYASRFLPPGRDLFGEIVTEAHARRMRVVGRFDLSKTQQPVYDAHPEWFFKRTDGAPVIYNGLYSACINGGYYREHAAKILTEALERYAVDGLFFNMFGNPAADYSGVPMGPCQCDACQQGFRARYGRALPTNAQDRDYREFMTASSREVAASIADLIHRLRPGAAFLTYIEDYTDVIMLESNTSVTRPLPLWPYSASDNVNRSRTAEPGKGVFNLCMSFVDFPWRQVTVPSAEIQLRLHQNLAHGGPPAFVVVGTPDQEDRQALIAAKPVFQWHAQHEDIYLGQENAARVLLLTTGDQNSYRGFFRMLSEQHIPFAATGNLKWLDDSARRYDLVIAPSGAAPQLERYVRTGGRLLIAGPSAPPATLPIAKVVGLRPATQGAWRIHDHALLPSLKDTNLVFLNGPYVELEPKPGHTATLTLIPPAMFGPPEKVWVDKVETTIPGLLFAEYREGRIAYVPWDIGGLYYRHGSQAHAALMSDVVDHLLPRGRQVKSNAHPLVEITVMRQPQHKRTLVHFVNLSGHSDVAYFSPIEMREIEVSLDESFARARAVKSGAVLTVVSKDRRSSFTLPRLGDYEVVVLE